MKQQDPNFQHDHPLPQNWKIAGLSSKVQEPRSAQFAPQLDSLDLVEHLPWQEG